MLNYPFVNELKYNDSMTITDLNQYLRTNMKCKIGDFGNDFLLGDKYSLSRNDASIYCWSGMNSVTNQIDKSANYCAWMQECAHQMSQNESQFESEQNILPRVINCVKRDGDDLCDEQSIGWYLAVFTYMYCLAFNRYDFEEIFLKNWRIYFTEEYQKHLW